MKADIGWLMGHIRISDRPGFKHGDHDWQEIVTLTVAIDGVAELSGLRSEHWKVAHRSAVGRLLWQLGFKRVRWARHLPGGEEHIVEFGLERFAGQACNS